MSKSPKALLLFLAPACFPGWATDYPCGPGVKLNLSADIVLTGADTVTAVGTSPSPCQIAGNGHSITGTTTGNVTFQFVTFSGLGTATSRAVSVTLTSSNVFTMNTVKWDATAPSGAVTLVLNGTSTATIRSVSIAPDAAAYPITTASPAEPGSVPAFLISGSSTATPKTFAGNVIQKSFVDLTNADRWTIGGTTDADANLVIGLRAGIYVGTNSTLQHNYAHSIRPTDPTNCPASCSWSEVSMINAVGTNSTGLDNIIHLGQWAVRGIGAGASWHDNVVIEHNPHYHILAQNTIQNNIFGNAFAGLDRYDDMTTTRTWPEESAFIPASNSASLINNTFDSRNFFQGTGMMIAMQSGATGNVVKNNAFLGIHLGSVNSVIDQSEDTKTACNTTARATYEDYNAFQYRAGETRFSNYCIAIPAATACVTTGFGAHDPTGCSTNTATNTSGNLGLRGPLPIDFPFDDRDILAGTVKVSDMLNYYRSVYAPGTGSILIGAADNATDIGAVQSATAPPAYVTNRGPMVYAGPSFVAAQNSTVNLQGFCGDDGLPTGTLNCDWSQVSGPVNITITPSGSAHPPFPRLATASGLTAPGVYTLRLTASDGVLTRTDDAQFTVKAAYPYRLFTSDQVAGWQARRAANDSLWVLFKAIADTQKALLVPSMTVTGITNANPAVVTIAETVPFSGGAATQACFVGGGTGAWAAMNTPSTLFSPKTCTRTGTNTFTVNVDTTAFGSYSGQDIAFWVQDGDNAYLKYGDSSGSQYEAYARIQSMAYLASNDATYCTNNSGASGAIALANWVAKLINHGIFAVAYGDSGRATTTVGSALGYPWNSCNALISGGQKANYISAITALWNTVQANPNGEFLQRTGNPLGNYFTTQMTGWSKMAYAFLGEDPIALTIHNSYAATVASEVVPAFAGATPDFACRNANSTGCNSVSSAVGVLSGGLPPEGWQYGPGMYANYALYTAWRKLNTGEDVLSTYLDNHVTHAIYARKPNLWETGRDGEMTGPYGMINYSSIWPLIWSLTELGRTTASNYLQQFWNNRVLDPQGCNMSQGCAWLVDKQFAFELVGHAATDYTVVLPSYSYPGGDGHFYWRSDWTTNATHLQFRSGMYTSDHIAYNVGNVELAHGPDWVLVTGNYWGGLPGYQDIGNSNRDPQSKYSNVLYADDGHTYCYASTDGCGIGQGYWLNPTYKLSPNFFYAMNQLWPGYAKDSNHDPNYAGRIVKSYLRSATTMGPNVAIFHDRVLMANISNTKRLHWHLRQDSVPSVSGNTVTGTMGATTFYIVTLSPAASTITAADDPSAGNGSPLLKLVKVSDAGVASTTFTGLTVVYMSALGNPLPATTTITTSANFIGAQIADTTASVFVAANTATPVTTNGILNYTSDKYNSVTFTSTHPGSGNYLVTGLLPGTYQVTGSCTGTCSGIAVGVDGALYFTGSSGAHTISVGAPVFTITTTSPLPPSTVGASYSQTVVTANGIGDVTACAITAGSLPAGLSAALITGTPATAATSNFTLQATDSASNTASQAFAVIINAAPVISTASPLSTATVNSAFTQTLAATGGTLPLTWSITAGTPPAGISLSAAGVLSGTPTAVVNNVQPSGTFGFTVRATDAAGVLSATKIFVQYSLPKMTYLANYPQNCSAVSASAPDYVDSANSQCAVPNQAPLGSFVVPAVNSSYVDGNFGTWVTIRTAEGFTPGYFTPPALNADSTMAIVEDNAGTHILNLADGTYKCEGLAGSDSDTPFWDANNPNFWYRYTATRIEKFTVSACEFTTLKDFPQFAAHGIGNGGTGGPSKDNWVSFFTQGHNSGMPPAGTNVCAINLTTTDTYCADYTIGGAVAHAAWAGGGADSTRMSKGVDSISGKRYVLVAGNPGAVVYSVGTTGNPGTLNFEYRMPAQNSDFDSISEPVDSDGAGPLTNDECVAGLPNGSMDAPCISGTHGDTFEDVDGQQYLLMASVALNTPTGGFKYFASAFRLNAGVFAARRATPDPNMRPADAQTLGKATGGRRDLFLLQGISLPQLDNYISAATKAPYAMITNSMHDTPVGQTAATGLYPHLGELIVMRGLATEFRRELMTNSVWWSGFHYYTLPKGSLAFDAAQVIFQSNFGHFISGPGGFDNSLRVATAQTGFNLAGLTISTGSPLSNGTIAVAYNGPGGFQFTASGGTLPLTWTISAGALPSGLALSSAGVLSGTPISSGTYNFTVMVTDSIGTRASAPFSLTISASVIPGRKATSGRVKMSGAAVVH